MFYSILRLIGLFIRPFSVLVLSFNTSISDSYTLILVALQICMSCLKIECHKNYYKDTGNKHAFLTYKNLLMSHIALFIPLLVCISFLFLQFNNQIYLVIFLFIIVFEKLYDEHLRLSIYKKNFKLWSILAIYRYYALNLLLIAFSFIYDLKIEYILILWLFLLVVGISLNSKSINCLYNNLSFRIKNINIKDYFVELFPRKHFILVLYAICTSQFINLPKITISISQPDLLSEFYILSTVFLASIPVSEAILVAKYKMRWLREFNIVLNEWLKLLFFGILFFACSFFAFELAVALGYISELKSIMLPMLAISILLYIIYPFQIINFWHIPNKKLLYINGLTFLLASLIIVFVPGLTNILWFLAASYLFLLSLNLYVYSKPIT